MSSLDNRIKKLENNQPVDRRLVIRYEDKTTPEELEALKQDPEITLLIVRYKDAPKTDEPGTRQP